MDNEQFTYTFEMPTRREDCPPPSSKTIRRITTPDGAHWFDVRGGGTQVEGKYLDWVQDRFTAAVRKHQAGEIDQNALEAAEIAYNAALATFIGDRVVGHNLTDDDGDPLPTGVALFWAMRAPDAMRLVVNIQRRESIWADPKVALNSMTG